MKLTKYQREILETAKKYYEAGCNVIPVPYGLKGGKEVYWQPFQNKRPSMEQVIAWFSDGKNHNIAMLGGKTSSNSIPVGFNDPEVRKRFWGDTDPLQFTRVHSSSPGHYHDFIKTDEDVKIEMTDDKKIEIRGDGSITIIPPSIHPETGKPYRSLNPDQEIAFVPNFWDWVEERCFAAGYLLVNKKFIKPPDDIQQILKGPLKEHTGREPKMFRLACYLTEFWDRDKIQERLHLLNKIPGNTPMENKLVEKAVRDAFKEQYVKSREQRRKRKEEKEKVTPITFDELENGSLAEIVYDTKNRRGQLLIYRDGEVTYTDKIEDRGKILVPKIDPFVEKDAMKLPGGVEDYGTRNELIDRVEAFIREYVEYPEPHFYRFSAYYVLMSWLYDRFNTVFYLRHTGAIGAGKTTAGEILGSICYKGIFMGAEITPAGLFRLMDSWRGTLIIDEAEFRPNSDVYDGVLKILNAGSKKGGYVTRTEKEPNGNYTTVPYIAYGPKILGSRTGSEMATESRMITITMRPRTKRTESEDLYELERDKFEARALSLRNQLLKYRLDNYRHLTLVSDKNIDNPRLRAMLIPIFTLSRGDKGMDSVLLKIVQDYREEMEIVRSESLTGRVAEIIVDTYNLRGFVSVRDVVSAIEGVTPEKVGTVVRKELRLKTEREIVDGTRERWIKITRKDIQRLTKDYGLILKKEPPVTKLEEL